MALQFTSYAKAVSSRSSSGSWARSGDRLRPEVWPEIKPSFHFSPGETIFTIGSCFARNIEEHLGRLGFKIPTLDFPISEADIFTNRRNAILNKYTPPSISQEIKWAADLFRRGRTPEPEDCAIYAYQLDNGLVIDNNLAGFKPVSRQHFLDRRRRLFDLVKMVFHAEVIVITPGVAEAWYDSQRGIFIQNIVKQRQSSITDHLLFTMLDYQSCFQNLDDAIIEIRSLNPNCKILLTTSPVPLGNTFTGDDIIVANSHAKSLLRAACGELAANRHAVDYFPSFESVTYTRSWAIFEKDLLHITDAFVAKIVSRLADAYVQQPIDEGERHYRASLEIKNPQESLKEAARAKALSPTSIDYRLRCADLLLQIGRYSEAFVELEEAQRLFPNDARPALHMKSAIETLEQKLSAETLRDAVMRFLALAPTFKPLHTKLIQLLLQLGDPKAEDVIHKLIALDGRQPGPHLSLIAFLRRNERNDEALAVAVEQLEHHPDNWRFLIQAGLLNLTTGNRPAARELLLKARAIAPDQPQVIRAIAKLDDDEHTA